MNALHNIYKSLLFLTLLLIGVGGLVTSTDSGLSVPDWPLSYGSWFPPMVGGIRYEHTHRMIAGLVLIFTLIAWALSLRNRKEHAGNFIFVTLAMAMVVFQAILGGLTVLFLLPKPISIAHACMGQIFFSLLCVLHATTSPRGSNSLNSLSGWVFFLISTQTIIAFFQLFLGAWVRHHSGGGVVWHITIGLFFLLWSTLTLLAIISKHKDLKNIVSAASAITGLLYLQFLLGIFALIHTVIKDHPHPKPAIEVLSATAHQTLGAIILGLVAILQFYAFKDKAKSTGS